MNFQNSTNGYTRIDDRKRRRDLSQAVKIGANYFTITSDDDYLVHVGKVFQPEMCKLFDSLLESNHTALDIGANIGCTSILFGQKAKKVISFEPSPTTFRLLDLNIKNSGLNNVEIHNVGLGAEDEKLTLTFAASDRGGGFVSNKTQADARHIVEDIFIRNGESFNR